MWNNVKWHRGKALNTLTKMYLILGTQDLNLAYDIIFYPLYMKLNPENMYRPTKGHWKSVSVHRHCVFLKPCESVAVWTFFFWRCTRRSECRRAEEKNGWLWSPKQECVKIRSFTPPNLSCKKTQKVQRSLISLFLCSFYPFVLFSCFCLGLALQNTTPLKCTPHKHARPE